MIPSRWPVALLLVSIEPAAAQGVHHVGPGYHATIQAAVNAAAAGDVVLVAAGAYPAFTVDKPLTITAAPAAFVQVVAAAVVAITLQPMERVHFAGLAMLVDAVTQTGGITSYERCTLRTVLGVRVEGGMTAMRWSVAEATLGDGVQLQDAHLHASDCSFRTLAGHATTVGHGAVRHAGTGTVQLAQCTLFGAWPWTAAQPWPAAALHCAGSSANARLWLSDSMLVAGTVPPGFVGPAVAAAPTATSTANVRLHRCAVLGGVLGTVATGPVVGVSTPVDLQIGAPFAATMRGEPGHLLLFYAGHEILGPFGIFEVEQPALGFFGTAILGVVAADASGRATFPFTVPNQPALRHLTTWWRGLDVSVFPWQATPAFVTVVQ